MPQAEPAATCPPALRMRTWEPLGVVGGEDDQEGTPAGLSFFVCDTTVITSPLHPRAGANSG